MKKKLYLKIPLILLIIGSICFGCYYMFVDKMFYMTGRLLLQDTQIEEELQQLEKGELQVEGQKTQEEEDQDQAEDHKTTEQGKQDPSQEAGHDIDKQRQEQDNKSSQDLTFEEKRRIVQLVSSKLSASDINYLKGLLKGGLTPEKKRQAVNLALKKFTSQEIKEIRALYHKYTK
jgi:hypothetical protein